MPYMALVTPDEGTRPKVIFLLLFKSVESGYRLLDSQHQCTLAQKEVYLVSVASSISLPTKHNVLFIN